MFKQRAFIIAALLILSVSCTKNRDQATFQKGAPDPGGLNDVVKYKKSEASSKYGRFELYSISDSYLKQRQAEVAGKRLKPLHLQSEFGVDAYFVEGYEIPRTVLIAPKIMLRSSIKGTKPLPREVSANEIELDTQIALFDGTESLISSGLGKKIYSDKIKIKSPEKLLATLKELVGGDPNFLGALPCPDSVSIVDPSQGSFDVKIRTPMKSCPTNIFIPAVVRFKKDEFEKFKAGFARSGSSSVTSYFSLGTPITLSYGKFTLNSQIIYDQIVGELKDPKEWSSADGLESTLASVITKIQASVEQCIPQEPFAPLKDQIISELFDVNTQPNCPDNKAICYLLKSRTLESKTIGISLRREDYFGDKLRYESSSVLSDSLSEQTSVLIRNNSPDLLSPPQSATINNALRTVSPGDIIEISVLKFRQSQYEFDNPKVQNISNPVCLAPFKECLAGQWNCTNPNIEDYNCRSECTGGWDRVCVRGPGCGGCYEWGQKCRSYSQVCDQRKVCERLEIPATPVLPFRMDKVSPTAVDFAWSCTNQTDSQCDPEQIQDQWQRITKFSNPFPRVSLVDEPFELALWENVLDGIRLQFSNGVECEKFPVSVEIIKGRSV